MAHVNLLPPEIRDRRETERRLVVVVAVMVAYVAILAMVFGFQQFKIYQEQQVLEGLRMENNVLEAQIVEFRVFEERKSELSRRQQLIETALSNEVSWYRILVELSMVIPEDVSIQGFSSDGREVTVDGRATDFESLAIWMVRFESLPEISDVWLDNVSVDETGVIYTLKGTMAGAGGVNEV